MNRILKQQSNYFKDQQLPHAPGYSTLSTTSMSGGRNPDDYYISGSTSGVHPYLHRELMNKMNKQTEPMNEFMMNYKGSGMSDIYMNLAHDINRLIMSHTGNKSLVQFLFKQLVKYFGKESSMNVGGVSFDEVKNKQRKL